MALDTNPFVVLSYVSGPALLTNATSLILLSTTNRFARAIDRSRQLTALLGKPSPERLLTVEADELRTVGRRIRLIGLAIAGLLSRGGNVCPRHGDVNSGRGARSSGQRCAAGPHRHIRGRPGWRWLRCIRHRRVRAGRRNAAHHGIPRQGICRGHRRDGAGNASEMTRIRSREVPAPCRRNARRE